VTKLWPSGDAHARVFAPVNGTLDEVSLIVLPPPPYGPPGVLLPGLVTETIMVPAVAMAEAGSNPHGNRQR
jgi:hypothetical protein